MIHKVSGRKQKMFKNVKKWKKTKNVQKCKEEPEVKGGASQSLELYLVLPTKEKLPNPQQEQPPEEAEGEEASFDQIKPQVDQ